MDMPKKIYGRRNTWTGNYVAYDVKQEGYDEEWIRTKLVNELIDSIKTLAYSERTGAALKALEAE